jgi:hypothetical protein
MSNRRSSRRRRLVRPYIVFVLVLLCLTAACWAYLWSGLSAYEKGIPANIMNDLVASLEQSAERGESCADLLDKYGSTHPGFDATLDGALLSEALGSKKITHRKATESTASGAVQYQILADGEKVANVELTAKKQGIFGLEIYEIHRISGTRHITILAVPGVQVYVSGQELTDEQKSDEVRIPKDLRALSEFPQNRIDVPSYETYVLDGLFRTPEIRGRSASGQESEGVFINGDQVIVSLPISEELLADMEERATTITKKYSYYMSDNLVWGGFRSYIVNTAPVYDRLRTLEVYWYTLHDSTRFENMSMQDWVLHTDRLLSLRMTYDFIVVGQGKVTTYPTDLTYYLAKEDDGVWRVAEMIVN